jgi:hypothetical protein
MYKEIYFWMYSYLSRIKTNKTPAFNSYIIICVLQLFNIGTLGGVINFFFRTDIEKTLAVYVGLTTMCFLYILNYFLLYNKREEIFKKYKDAPARRRTTGQLYFWIYVLLSFTIFFVVIANLVTQRY